MAQQINVSSGYGGYMGGGRRSSGGELPPGYGSRGITTRSRSGGGTQGGLSGGQRSIRPLTQQQVTLNTIQSPYGPMVVPNWQTNSFAGTPGGAFGAPAPLTDLDALLQEETDAMQSLSDQHTQSLSDIAGRYERELGSRQDALDAIIDEQMDFGDTQSQLNSLAEWSGKDLIGMVEDVASGVKSRVDRTTKMLDAFVNETRDDARAMVEDAIRRSDDALRKMARASNNFQDRAAAAASAAVRGEHRRIGNMRKQIAANPNMSASQKAQMMAELQVEAGQAAAEAAAPLMLRYEEMKLQAEQNVAQMAQVGSETVLRGLSAKQAADELGLRAISQKIALGDQELNSVRNLADTIMGSQRLQSDLARAAAEFRLSWTNNRAATQVASIQSLANNMMNLFNMQMNNAPSYISRWSGAMQLETIRRANEQSAENSIRLPSYDGITGGLDDLRSQLEELVSRGRGGGTTNDADGRPQPTRSDGEDEARRQREGDRQRARALSLASAIRTGIPTHRRDLVAQFNREFGTDFTLPSEVETWMRENGYYG